MNFLMSYSDNNDVIHTQLKNTIDYSIADVCARLLAYKSEGEVMEVKYFEYEDGLKKAIKFNSATMILKLLNEVMKTTITMDNVEKLAEFFNIKCEVPKDDECWHIIDDHVISFTGEFNVYGRCIITCITIYDNTDSIISQINIKEGKKI